ncbi:MAG: TetR/AcrR family transcriptional regulator [Treponema sp.]|jgi:lantibiotic modifying enzyme|nr:TetR/AcrR family transcriptional regulator [Treponema sp.]
MLREPSTKTHICEKLIEMMQHKPCFEIKVTELVKYANISRSSFYSYFNSIYDVVQKIEDDFIAGLPNERFVFLSCIKDDDYDTLLSRLNYLKENIRILRAFLGPNGDPTFLSKLVYQTEKMFRKQSKQMPISFSDVEIKLIIENISGGTWQMYKWWVFHEDEISMEDLTELIRKIHKHLLHFSQNETGHFTR